MTEAACSEPAVKLCPPAKRSVVPVAPTNEPVWVPPPVNAMVPVLAVTVPLFVNRPVNSDSPVVADLVRDQKLSNFPPRNEASHVMLNVARLETTAPDALEKFPLDQVA